MTQAPNGLSDTVELFVVFEGRKKISFANCEIN